MVRPIRFHKAWTRTRGLGPGLHRTDGGSGAPGGLIRLVAALGQRAIRVEPP